MAAQKREREREKKRLRLELSRTSESLNTVGYNTESIWTYLPASEREREYAVIC